MTKWSPLIDAEEEFNTRTENFDTTGSSASVTLRCTYTDAHSLINDLLGNEREYPYNNEVPVKLFAKSAQLKPTTEKYQTDGDGQIIDYINKALVTVGYKARGSANKGGSSPGDESVDPEDGTPITVSDSIEDVSEFLIVENKNLCWLEADAEGEIEEIPLKSGEEAGKFIPVLKFTRAISGMRRGPSTSILELTGKVNDKPIENKQLGMTFQKGQLLFLNPTVRTEQVLTPFNLKVKDRKKNESTIPGGRRYERTFSWTLSWLLRPITLTEAITGETTFPTWNWFYRGKTSAWEQIYNTIETFGETSRPHSIYEEADFVKILFPNT